jgi:hypothetical protein
VRRESVVRPAAETDAPGIARVPVDAGRSTSAGLVSDAPLR